MNRSTGTSAAAAPVVPLSAVMPVPPLDDERAWAAVLAREGHYDGRFVYAVTSTGVYCRPSCPSRRPVRRNVAFFRDPAGAEAAGYRACLRCHPRASATASALAVAKVRAYIDAHADEPLTLAVLAREAGLSPHHLQRVFKRATGLSPKEYAGAVRTQRFKAHVKKESSVTTAIYEAGYGSGSRVYESADARLGMTPATYRQGGRGMQIHYTITDSPLGRLLVGATERGVCAVQLGASDRALAAALTEEYPRAEVQRDDATLGPWVEAILDHLQGRSPALDLPLDLQATAFQWSVWKALREIPYGSTRSYAEIAAAVGKPRAVRAVARACAANRVALVVPCHRVIGSDGRAGGYRWGAERKQRLLDQEKARASRRGRSR
jgi:AraC family transcriptional regulator of adaptative response/methylated-DNA-[protein]-cysteine methyltransferase